jgi:4-amino-4-deoxychorismate lyase
MFLLETIKVQNQQLRNIYWHNQRLNRTRQLLFGATDERDLEEIIETPTDLTDAIYKCRVTYGLEIEKIEFESYSPKPIKTLKIIHQNRIDYSFKYANRSGLHALYAQKENCDDVLIIKNGLITDTSYCNIAFFDGKNWLTPEKPLLEGTERAFLLSEGILQTVDISVQDLKHFQYFKLFNAMMNWNEQEKQMIKNVERPS